MRRVAALTLLSLAASADAAAGDPVADPVHDDAALELEPCRISAGPAFPSIKARCGTLVRPLDPDDPSAASIDVAVAVVPALNLSPEPDPFVPIAGGPGQSSIEFYASHANAFEEVRRSRDILLVDQRGTGDSARLDCPVEDEIVEGSYSTELVLDATRECLDALPADPRFFTTSVAVTDLEAVRVALAYPQLNLYGVSYGSRVAQHYARRYPDATRSIVLDGVVPPQLSLGPEIATEAQRALDGIFARCAKAPACNERFPDLPASFRRVREALEAGAVIVDLPDPLTGRLEAIEFGQNELAVALRLLAYDAGTMALVPLLVDEAAAGRYGPLAAQYRMIATSLFDALALGMHNAVMCTEDVPFFDPAAIDTAALEASYMGPMQLEALEAICSVWPAGPIDEDFREPLATDIPVLLLSGSADPITPPRYAEMAMVELGNKKHVTVTDQGHGQAPIGCMPRVIRDFVASADPQVDAGCRERSFTMPFFTDFTGPAP